VLTLTCGREWLTPAQPRGSMTQGSSAWSPAGGPRSRSLATVRWRLIITHAHVALALHVAARDDGPVHVRA